MNTLSDIEPVKKKPRLDTSSPECVKSALKTKSSSTARKGDQDKGKDAQSLPLKANIYK